MKTFLTVIAAASAMLIVASSALAGNGLCNDPFDCNGPDDSAPAVQHHQTSKKAPTRLTGPQAKIETRRRANIEQAAWGYNGSVMEAFASKCTRRSARAIDCGFALYYLNNEYAPPRSAQKYCSYVDHVRLPKGSRKPTSTLEMRSCRPM